jgi:O-antigen/teichoic acid export membrane protein
MSQNDTDTQDSGMWTVLRESSFVFVASIISMALGFATNFIMARWFGAEVVGRFALVQSVVNILSIVTVFGLNVGLVKYVPRLRTEEATERIRHVVATALIVSFGLSVVVGAALAFGRDLVAIRIFNDPVISDLLILGAALLVPVTLVKVLGGLYQAFKLAGLQRLIGDVGYRTVFCAGMIALAALHIETTDWAIGAYLGAYVLALSLLVLFARRFDPNIFAGLRAFFSPSPEQREDRAELLGFSSTMILISVMSFLLAKTDILMVGYFRESSEVGVYKIAVLVANLVMFILASVNAIFPSVISELFAEERIQELESMYATITKWSLVGALPVVACMGFYATPLVEFFGPEYSAAATSLIVLAAGNFVNVAVGSNGHILKMSGHERLVLANNAVLAVINIGLNIVLIPEFGILGAALATSGAIVMISLIKIVELKWLLGIFPYRLSMLLLVLSAAAMAGLGFLTMSWVDSVWKVVLMGVGFGLLSLAGAYATLDERDRTLLGQVKNKFSG